MLHSPLHSESTSERKINNTTQTLLPSNGGQQDGCKLLEMQLQEGSRKPMQSMRQATIQLRVVNTRFDHFADTQQLCANH